MNNRIISEEEKEFLANYDANKYPKPCVTVDNIIYFLGEKTKLLWVLMVKRKNYPYKGCWALPGGFLDVGKENTEQATLRELQEETSLELKNTKLFGVYSDPDRDPRDHVVSVVYATEVKKLDLDLCAQDDAEEVAFMRINHEGKAADAHWTPVEVAFDHNKILQDFQKSVSGK